MHVFISFKTKRYQEAISYLESRRVSNIRLVEFDYNSKETMVEADVPAIENLGVGYQMKHQYGSVDQSSERMSLTGIGVESSVKNQYRLPSAPVAQSNRHIEFPSSETL